MGNILGRGAEDVSGVEGGPGSSCGGGGHSDGGSRGDCVERI